MSSSSGTVGAGGIKWGDTEHDNVVKFMQQQVGAERDSKSTERGGASAQDEATDKRVRPDQRRYDSESNPNNNNSISVGHYSGRDDGTEGTKHQPSAQREYEKMTSTGRKLDSIYFSERDR